jgi:hypothetical protein
MIKHLLVLLCFCTTLSFAQSTQDKESVKEIYDAALSKGKAYDMLRDLTSNIGPRLSGSAGAAAAVTWGNTLMKTLDFDSVWLQPLMVPHWVRGEKEQASIITKKGNVPVNVCALGGSVGTGPAGITAGVVEVKNFDELKQLGKKGVQGKIVFFNRPMDPTKIHTFEAYGGAVDQRAMGASEASKYGALAVVVRSMSTNIEDYPHTGGMRYAPDVTKIPGVAIATRHAELLSKSLKEDKDLQFTVVTHSEILEDVESFNVVGELKGTEYKDEIIVVGGHLDSWDLAQGAHDDGTGCVQSIEVLRILKSIGYKPKRTIRAVLFMNEENGLRGGLKYAELAAKNKEKNVVAIESDEGGFTPRGFSMTGDEKIKTRIRSWKSLLEPYGLHDFGVEGGGADIGPLASQGTFQVGYMPDPQRYFSLHHTQEDTFDKVDQRELELGAASMTALVFLLDKYGYK